MQLPLHILFLSAGTMDGSPYASAVILSDDAEDLSGERIAKGKRPAKVKIVTDNGNELAKRLARDVSFPCTVPCTIKQSVKGGEATISITGFTAPK